MTTRTHHPLANIAEWRKGCSCAPKEFPVQCEACTEGLIKAIENWFTQHRGSRILGIAGILEDLDARAGLPMTVDAQAAAIIRHLEVELYVADDQVEGLQELIRANTVPAILDTAVRYLVGAADCDPDNDRTGSPQHGHRIAGRWDGDGTNRKGALCEECAAWNIMRKYAATDIVAEAQVIEPKPGDVWALPVDLVVELQALPQVDGHPKEALDKLGIRYESYWGNPLTGCVSLLGCTNVPVNLPAWLTLRSKP